MVLSLMAGVVICLLAYYAALTYILTGRATMLEITGVLLPIVTVLTLGCILALILWVLRPIVALHHDVASIAAHPDRSGRVRQTSQDEVGMLAQAFNHLLDVRERSEADLAESARRFEAIMRYEEMVESTPLVAIRGVDRAGVVLHWNSACKAIFDVGSAEAMGRRVQDFLLPSNEVDAFETALAEIWDDGRASATQEWCTYSRSGQQQWIYSTIFPVKADGEVVEVFCMDVDITARKQTEESLRESERFAQQVIDTTPNIIYIHDLELERNTYCNPGISRIAGYEPEVLQRLGADMLATMLHPDDTAKIAAHHASIQNLGDGEVVEIEYRMRHADGRWLVLHTREVVFSRTPDGRPRCIIGTAQDVTEQRWIETALRQQRDKARNYLDIAGVIIIALDRDERVAMINRRGCEVLGRDEQEILGQFWSDEFVPKTYREPFREMFRAVMAGEAAASFLAEYPVITSRGAERIISWRRVVVRDDAGRITGTLSSGEDVTDHRRAEQMARKEMAKFYAMITGMEEGVVFADAWGRVIDVNDWFARFVGREREEILGCSLSDFANIVDSEILAVIDEFAVAPDLPAVTVDRRIGEADVMIRIHAVNLNGGYDGILLNIIDVSELAAANRRIAEQQAEVARATKMATLGTMAASIAHEINNPLVAVAGYSESLLGKLEGLTPEQLPCIEIFRRRLQIINDEAFRCKRITQGLLGYSHAGAADPVGSFDIRDAVVRAVELLTVHPVHSPESAVRLDLGDEPLLVFGDRDQHVPVFLNLGINAFDAMSVGSLLHVTARRLDNAVEIVFRDEGSGMTPEILGRIFDPFFTTKDAGAGTGLGMVVVRDTIASCGGEVTVESELGKGTVFTIRLPLAPDASARKAA